MSNIKPRARRKPVSEINVVPYIDVMLVLLVIFMITAPMLTQGVKIDMPQASAEVLDNNTEEPIIVSVNDKGEYFLNISTQPQKAMSPESIAIRVAAELQLARQVKASRPVLVKGSRQVDYGKVVAAMVLLQKAGAKSIGLMTSPPPEMAQATQNTRTA